MCWAQSCLPPSPGSTTHGYSKAGLPEGGGHELGLGWTRSPSIPGCRANVPFPHNPTPPAETLRASFNFPSYQLHLFSHGNCIFRAISAPHCHKRNSKEAQPCADPGEKLMGELTEKCLPQVEGGKRCLLQRHCGVCKACCPPGWQAAEKWLVKESLAFRAVLRSLN